MTIPKVSETFCLPKTWEFLKFWSTLKEVTHQVTLHTPLNSEYYPPKHMWFRALELTPFDKVKVVILGQDPYHTKGVAHGLAFSVQPHNRIPPSLRNIFKELQGDLGLRYPSSGDLRAWASEGILLLNTILTVAKGKPLSHRNIGWEKLCYEVLRSLSDRGNAVCLLMGKQAQEFTAACEPLPCIAVAHPSPLSQNFLGSKPFSRVNSELKKLGVSPVNWSLR